MASSKNPPADWCWPAPAQLLPGQAIAIFGAGPAGLLAGHSAVIQGAAQVFVVDQEPDRLALAEATAVNFAEVDPVEVVMDSTEGFGADCGVEAVGYQAHDQHGQEHPELVLDNPVKVVRATATAEW